jgi:hypothetical protein
MCDVFRYVLCGFEMYISKAVGGKRLLVIRWADEPITRLFTCRVALFSVIG